MARLGFGGAEWQDPRAEKLTKVGTVNIDTTNPRTGAAAYSFPTAGTNCCELPTSAVVGSTFTGTGGNFFVRVPVRFAANPGALTRILSLFYSPSSIQTVNVDLDTSGRIVCPDGTTLSAALSAGAYHEVELKWSYDGSTTYTWEVRVGGVSIGTGTVASANRIDRIRFGNVNGAAHATTLLVDDWALNDDTGSAQTSWCGIAGKVLVSFPTADSADGADWKLGNNTSPGGAAWDAVNNKPPTGTATAGGSVQDTVSGTTEPASDIDLTCQSYTTAGMPSGNAPTVARAYASASNGGSATVHVTFAVRLVSNPAEGAETSGYDAFNKSTWPTNWTQAYNPPLYSPTVTAGTAPVVRVGKRTLTTQALTVAAVGILFEYEPTGTTYTDAPSGGITPTGTDSEVHLGVDGPSGGVTPTGTDGEIHVGTDGISGGITPSGSDSEIHAGVDGPSGGITPSGSNTDLFGQGDVVTGGVTPAGTDDEVHVGIDGVSGGITPSGTDDEARVYPDGPSGGIVPSGSEVDDWSIVVTPPTPTPLSGLFWQITGLWYPEATEVNYYGHIADPQDGQVRIPLDDSRTAKVTVSIFDTNTVQALLGHTYARCFRVYYHGICIFWGPVTLADIDLDAGTVTFSAVDPSIRLIHHALRRGDLAGALNASNHDRATVSIDAVGLRLIRDAAKNTAGQTARGVPDIGIADGVNDFPVAPSDLMGVARWDPVWGTMQELSNAQGPDFELQPVDDTVGVYCQLNTYVKQGTDISDIVQFHYGFGKDNLDDLKWTEGSKYVTHVQTLDRDQTYRITPANLAASAETGPYVEVVITDFDAHGIPETQVDNVLSHYAEDVIAAYSPPLIEATLTLPVETDDSFRYLRDFGVGDEIGVAGKKGGAQLAEGAYRITEVALTQEGDLIRPEVAVISPQNATINTEE